MSSAENRRRRKYVDADRPQPVWSRGVAASLLTVWSRALSPGSRERGGRTIPQKGGNRCKLSMISDCTVCPSDSRFRPITKDLGRLREMPSFALSRRQHGFESRWGYKIKPPLTRPDTTGLEPAYLWLHRQGRARDAGTPAGAASRLADFACRNMGSSAGGVVLSRGCPSSGNARPLASCNVAPSTIRFP
jgi:hypothetical protein